MTLWIGSCCDPGHILKVLGFLQTFIIVSALLHLQRVSVTVDLWSPRALGTAL